MTYAQVLRRDELSEKIENGTATKKELKEFFDEYAESGPPEYIGWCQD